jgi:F-type H+-transporting ATPase subunit gamma
MASIKELKNKIKSVKSTRKITRALQMVSAAKMRKSQNMVLQSRNYSALAWNLIENVAPKAAIEHPLTKTYEKAKKIGLILISTNGGFVGSMNTNLFGAVLKMEDMKNPDVLADIITYGKKGQAMMARTGKNIAADFPKKEKFVNVEEIYPIAQMIMEKYQSGEYKKIYVAYNHFVSTLSQKPTIKQLLPFAQVSEQWSVNSGQQNKELPTAHSSLSTSSDYLFEPSPVSVLEHLLPRIIESQIYQAILENDASEHSARMVAMKNATEAAGDLIADYTLTFNQLRQGKITTELAEITAGKIALE